MTVALSNDFLLAYSSVQKSHQKKVREFIGKCRNADGGYGVTPGTASGASGTYYAGIILHWLDGGQ